MESLKRTKRLFTPEQKMNILHSIDLAIKSGTSVTAAVENQGIVHSMYRKWKRQFEVGMKSSLRNGKPPVDQDKKRLERENAKLKEIIISQSKVISDLKKETNWG
jgi:transposase-like protein